LVSIGALFLRGSGSPETDEKHSLFLVVFSRKPG